MSSSYYCLWEYIMSSEYYKKQKPLETFVCKLAKMGNFENTYFTQKVQLIIKIHINENLCEY